MCSALIVWDYPVNWPGSPIVYTIVAASTICSMCIIYTYEPVLLNGTNETNKVHAKSSRLNILFMSKDDSIPTFAWIFGKTPKGRGESNYSFKEFINFQTKSNYSFKELFIQTGQNNPAWESRQKGPVLTSKGAFYSFFLWKTHVFINSIIHSIVRHIHSKNLFIQKRSKIIHSKYWLNIKKR